MQINRDRRISLPDLISVYECNYCGKYYRVYQGHFDKGYMRRGLCSDACYDFQQQHYQYYVKNVQVKIGEIYKAVMKK